MNNMKYQLNDIFQCTSLVFRAIKLLKHGQTIHKIALKKKIKKWTIKQKYYFRHEEGEVDIDSYFPKAGYPVHSPPPQKKFNIFLKLLDKRILSDGQKDNAKYVYSCPVIEFYIFINFNGSSMFIHSLSLYYPRSHSQILFDFFVKLTIYLCFTFWLCVFFLPMFCSMSLSLFTLFFLVYSSLCPYPFLYLTILLFI